MLTNPTNQEQSRFKKLQDEGMLPSSALRKLESERVTGIIETSSLSKPNNNMLYLGLGAIGITMLYIYLNSKSTPAPLSLSNKQLKLEDIQGIDLNSLKIIKDNKLI